MHFNNNNTIQYKTKIKSSLCCLRKEALEIKKYKYDFFDSLKFQLFFFVIALSIIIIITLSRYLFWFIVNNNFFSLNPNFCICSLLSFSLFANISLFRFFSKRVRQLMNPKTADRRDFLPVSP